MTLVSQSKAQHRRTSQHKLEKLLSRRTQWLRKQTIATNKLDEVNREIVALTVELADKAYASEFTSAK